MDWISALTVDEARAAVRDLWRQREAAIAESDYGEVERLNLVLAAIAGRISDLGGDVDG